MPIHPNKKSLFIHIPKCAGSSIERALGMQQEALFFKTSATHNINGVSYAPQHLKLIDLLKFDKIQTLSGDLFVFTFVRNPYDRFVSEFFYDTKIKEFDKVRFKDWYKGFYKIIDSDHKLNQCDFLMINDEINVDFIGKYETLVDDFNLLLFKLGLPPTRLPHDKVNSQRSSVDYLSYLDSDDIKFINTLFNDDFKNFNYEMYE